MYIYIYAYTHIHIYIYMYMYTLIDNKNMGSGIPCFRRATTKSAPATTKSALTTTVHRARAWAQGVHAHQNGSDEVARVAQGARGQDCRHACRHPQVRYDYVQLLVSVCSRY